MNQTVRLGYGKISKTGNEIDKLKDLKNHNSKFKRDIKYQNKRAAHGKGDYEEDDNEKS